MRSHRRFGTMVLWLGSLILLAFGAGSADAALMLTAAGQAQGFTLANFITGFPNNGAEGPIGIGFPSTGGVLVTDYANGNVLKFAQDTNNQTAGSGVIGQNYGGNNPAGLATVGANVYMTRQGTGDLVQINSNGTFNQVITTGLPAATGIAADPANGHLFVSTLGNNVIWDVDPIAKTKTVFALASADGLSVSPDNLSLFAEVNGHIVGYNIATKSQFFDSGAIPGAPDGAAVGTGTLAGFVFTNTNSGTVVEINIATLAQTLIATGGSRGDFVTVDPNDGSLLLTQTDSIIRLIPPAGGGFGPPPPPPPPTVPEPSSLALLSLGGLGLAGWRRWKKRATA
jgi:PEP-CTERM motif